MKRNAEVDAYVAGAAEAARGHLSKVREIIIATAPDALETIGYGIPTYKYSGKPLVSFGKAARHVGFYALSPETFASFGDELSTYSTSKGTLRLPLGVPVPEPLIAAIVRQRMSEIERSVAAGPSQKNKREKGGR